MLEDTGLPPLVIDAPITGPEYASAFYRRSNSHYGRMSPSDYAAPRHGLSNKFSKAVGAAGNWRMNGLKTVMDRPRFVDGCLDWMLK